MKIPDSFVSVNRALGIRNEFQQIIKMVKKLLPDNSANDNRQHGPRQE